MCIVDHMCLLACNVCGGITAVAFSCCSILHLTLCGSTSGPAWYPSCPVISGKLPSSGLLHYLWFISVCVGHLSAVFTASHHCFYSTEIIFYFFSACPIYPAKVSHYYRPTSVDTASVHIVKGITIVLLLVFRRELKGRTGLRQTQNKRAMKNKKTCNASSSIPAVSATVILLCFLHGIVS